jgi:hypothetical protein
MTPRSSEVRDGDSDDTRWAASRLGGEATDLRPTPAIA